MSLIWISTLLFLGVLHQATSLELGINIDPANAEVLREHDRLLDIRIIEFPTLTNLILSMGDQVHPM